MAIEKYIRKQDDFNHYMEDMIYRAGKRTINELLMKEAALEEITNMGNSLAIKYNIPVSFVDDIDVGDWIYPYSICIIKADNPAEDTKIYGVFDKENAENKNANTDTNTNTDTDFIPSGFINASDLIGGFVFLGQNEDIERRLVDYVTKRIRKSNNKFIYCPIILNDFESKTSTFRDEWEMEFQTSQYIEQLNHEMRIFPITLNYNGLIKSNQHLLEYYLLNLLKRMYPEKIGDCRKIIANKYHYDKYSPYIWERREEE